MNVFKKILHRINQFQENHSYIGFPYALIKKYGEDEGGYQSALITYYGFLSLFPLLIVLTSVLQLVLRRNPALRDKILQSAIDYFPVIGKQLEQSISGGVKGTGVALVIGIVLTLFGARGVADAFRNALNSIWQIPYAKRTGFPWAIFKSLSIIVVGGLGLIAAPVIAGLATAVADNILFRVLSYLLSLGVLFLTFLFLIKMSVSEKKKFTHIWVSALTAAVGLLIIQSLGSFLLKKQLSNLSGLYGTFAVVLGLLYWIYLQAQVIVYAMEVDTVRSLHLWPRSLESDQLTNADERAYQLYAGKNRFQKAEDVDVTIPADQKDPVK